MKNEGVSLYFILALAFFLRLWGAGFGLPHLYHADEPIVVNHALAYGSGDFNPHFFKIPPLVSYLLFICYGVYFFLGKAAGLFSHLADFENFFYGDPSSFYLIARLIFGVGMGTFSVYVWYRICKQNFTERLGKLTALFLAVCFLHVRDSHYIYADIPLMVVLMFSFSVLFQALDKAHETKTHLLAGVLLGLATAVKYNGWVLFFPYLTVLLIARPLKKSVRYGLQAFTVSLITFFLLNPFALLDFPLFIQEIRIQSGAQTGVGWSHHLLYSLREGLGMPALALAVMGMIRAIFFGRERKRVLMGAFILFYYLVLCRTGQPYDRYVLPLVPFLVFFAADMAINLGDRIHHLPRIVRAAGLAVILGPGFLQSVLFDRVMSAKDNRTLAKEWVESNVQSGGKIALGWDFLMPRLSFSKKQIEEKRQELMKAPGQFSEAQLRKLDNLLRRAGQVPAYDLFYLMENPANTSGRFLFAKPVLPYSVPELRSRGIQYVILEMYRPTNAHLKFLEDLSGEAVLLKEFNPYRNAVQEYAYDPLPLTGGPLMFKDLWLRERNGQTLRIYRLEP